jgi:hypothetical protein
MLWRRARTDGSYLSASDPRVHFGLGGAADVEAMLVEWPRGGREVWKGVALNRILSVRQGSGSELHPKQRDAGARTTNGRMPPRARRAKIALHNATHREREMGNIAAGYWDTAGEERRAV